MEIDLIRMCELLVGLPEVNVLGLVDEPGGPVRVVVECRPQTQRCSNCGVVAWVKDRSEVTLVDLPVFGRPALLIWRKHRLRCPNPACPVGSWTVEEPQIAAPRLQMTDRAGRWATLQVGRYGRTVSEVAAELGCDWHTINKAVLAYRQALVDDPGRIGREEALGLDETLFSRQGPYRSQSWSTSIVDVALPQLLDVVEGRDAQAPARWLAARGEEWCSQIRWGVLDLSGAYQACFDTVLPDAIQVADPFHLVRVANHSVDECRRRLQNEALGHRGRKRDPLYRARRLLVRADERLDENGRSRLLGLLEAGDPHGEVRMAWHAKEVVRSIYQIPDPDLAAEFVARLAQDLQDDSCPPETNRLGRTLLRWRDQIVAWHQAQVTNGPTEALNNLIKRVKRVVFGFRRFWNYRIRALLYAGRPNWHLLATITPR